MESVRRFSWSEVRDVGNGRTELFFMTAEQTSAGWTFHESSTWHVRWFSVPATEDRLMKVTAELDGGTARGQ